ncbi:MAG TPA: hypothetical protein VIM59_13495 [Cellvibrio sp.]
MKKSRIGIWIILLATAITGVALFWLAPASEDDFPHPLNGLFRELHGASAMLAVFMFGYLFADHVQKKLHKKKHHWDGYLHLVLWSLLVISGLLLYYPQDSLQLLNVSIVHWYLGLGLCALFPLHFWRKAIIKYSQRTNSHKSRLP